MKIFTLLVGIMLAFTFRTMSQSVTDRAVVLQKCIDLPELQPFFLQQADGKNQQLYVMQHGVSFEPDIPVSKFGKSLVFMPKQEILTRKTNAYFLFQDFTVTLATARVSYAYYFSYNTNPEALLLVYLEMEKKGESWIVTQTKVERR